MSDTQIILHVRGTESETTSLPKQQVRAALSEGKITHSQLIWSPRDNAWKQVRELPELLPSQKLAPAPTRVRIAPMANAVELIIPDSPSNPVARAVAATGTPTPKVRVAGAPQVRVAAACATPQVRVSSPAPAPTVNSARDYTVAEADDGSNPFKWICIGLAGFILLVLGGNYLLVDQPLVSALGQTSFSDAKVYAHFGAFIQPNVAVIHIAPSASVTSGKLGSFLVMLANSTPASPSAGLFGRVALTTGWTAKYTFSGFAWRQLGDMRHQSAAEQKEFILAQICDAGGEPLSPSPTLDEASREAQSEKIWDDFVAYFTAAH
jgi:hypothetical protein